MKYFLLIVTALSLPACTTLGERGITLEIDCGATACTAGIRVPYTAIIPTK